MIIHGDYQNFQNDKFRAGLDNVKQIGKLCNKKASQNTDIPVKIIKENEDLIPYFYITILATDYLSYCHEIFRYKTRHKKNHKTDKENYRPIDILPNLSKIYKRIMGCLIPTIHDPPFSNCTEVCWRTSGI